VLARYRASGASALVDRRRVRHPQRRKLNPQHQQPAVELRHQRLHLRHVAPLIAAPISTVATELNRLGMGRLPNLVPKPVVQSYERQILGDMIHIDVKKLACISKVGLRIIGNRQQGRSTCVVDDGVHVAIDDTTRLTYVEVLVDEQQTTAFSLLSRAVAWFNGQDTDCRQGMSDNGSAYVSKAFAKGCSVLKLNHIRTRPNTQSTNGKTVRFIQTLCKELAYAMQF
jgi:transposase InsO family protein